MALTYFPVTATLKAATSDTGDDVDGNPDIQNISSFVYFTPNVDQVYTAADGIIRLATIRARTNPSDGALKNIDGTTVTLVANTAALKNVDGTPLTQLIYRVTFDHVVYAEGNQKITAFSFVAPTAATAVDLATVARLP